MGAASGDVQSASQSRLAELLMFSVVSLPKSLATTWGESGEVPNFTGTSRLRWWIWAKASSLAVRAAERLRWGDGGGNCTTFLSFRKSRPRHGKESPRLALHSSVGMRLDAAHAASILDPWFEEGTYDVLRTTGPFARTSARANKCDCSQAQFWPRHSLIIQTSVNSQHRPHGIRRQLVTRNNLINVGQLICPHEFCLK